MDSTIKVKTKLKLELQFKLLGIYFRTLKLRISRQKVERRKWKNTGENKKFADEYQDRCVRDGSILFYGTRDS